MHHVIIPVSANVLLLIVEEALCFLFGYTFVLFLIFFIICLVKGEVVDCGNLDDLVGGNWQENFLTPTWQDSAEFDEVVLLKCR